MSPASSQSQASGRPSPSESVLSLPMGQMSHASGTPSPSASSLSFASAHASQSSGTLSPSPSIESSPSGQISSSLHTSSPSSSGQMSPMSAVTSSPRSVLGTSKLKSITCESVSPWSLETESAQAVSRSGKTTSLAHRFVSMLVFRCSELTIHPLLPCVMD